MAEVLGVVSSGLSVVSVAVQLADSIKKLKDFYDLVREAPEELRLSLNEVQVLSFVLQDIELSVQSQSECSPALRAAVARSINLCRVSSEALYSLAQDLQHGIVSGRRWSSFKAALKKDKIARFQTKLEGAKTTLMLANQCYYHAIQRQDWELQRQDMSELKVTISTLNKSSEIHFEQEVFAVKAEQVQQVEDEDIDRDRDDKDICVAAEAELSVSRSAKGSETGRFAQGMWPAAIFGSVQYRKTRRQGHRKGHCEDFLEETNITIQLPPWLIAKRYQLRTRRAYSGWDHKFRAFNTVSHLSPVFQMCRQGDIRGLKQLFDDLHASPFDVDLNGNTLLHFAAFDGRLDTIRFLIDRGVDINIRSFGFGAFEIADCDDRTEMTPLEIFAGRGGLLTFMKNSLQVSEHFDVLHLLVEEGGADPFDTRSDGTNALNNYWGPTEGFRWLLAQSPNVGTLHHAMEEPLWVSLLSGAWENLVELVREGLPNRKVDREVTQQSDKRGLTFLHMALFSWYYSLDGWGRSTTTLASNLEGLLRETVLAGADLHALTNDGKSPIETPTAFYKDIFRGLRFPRTTLRRYRKALSSWFHLLQDCDVDCRAYAEREVARVSIISTYGQRIIWSVSTNPYKWIDIEWEGPDPPLSLRESDRLLYSLHEFWVGLYLWDHYQNHSRDEFFLDRGMLLPVCDCFDTEYEDEVDIEDKGDTPPIPGAWNP